MPTIESPNWNETSGVCEKHLLPTVPCPQCLQERDKDISVGLTETDRDCLDFLGRKVADFFPVGYDWLVQRIR